ncbi:MAG: PQQ-dependent sugar dehydrogenase [Planctomycetota bacterium]|jgi:glucose/arabinose dehydrogenase
MMKRSLMLLVLAAGLAPACDGADDEPAPGLPPPPARGEDETAGTLPSVRLTRAFPRLAFQRPVLITSAGDDRLFVLEQQGRIRVFTNRRDIETTDLFLDLRTRVRTSHNEEGLLGLAFDPDYAQNRRFYVYYSASEPRRSVLARFTADAGDPNRADPDSERVVLEVPQPYGNHNGGALLFGPDGYLYLSLGDGGWANDPRGHGQDLSTLLGTILRIDVRGQDADRPYIVPADNPFVGRADVRPEIWAYGLRNVWRMSFDRATGELWAGDVGQNAWEEIDLIVKGGNYGWSIREGAHPFRAGTAAVPLIDPVVEYPQRRGREVVGRSVTGGHVYRGQAVPGLVGAYVYGDYVTGRIWALRYAEGTVTDHREILSRPKDVHISSFGEDAEGELYLCGFDRLDGTRGRIYRLVED